MSYSINGVSYNPIVLFGDDDVWEGSVFIDEEMEEGILSFRFSGEHLVHFEAKAMEGE